MTGFDVDITALRQWSAMVERQRGYLDLVAGQKAAQITDGDFGVIMDLISGPYTDLLPRVDATLRQAVASMGSDSQSLSGTADDYADRDSKTGQRFSDLHGKH